MALIKTNARGQSSNLGRRNLIINGAMNVAQRGTTSTSDGFRTVDRFRNSNGGLDEGVTQEHHALTSSDTGVWELGFRHSYKQTNGNQSSGAGADDRVTIQYPIEGQDMTTSGWNYTSPSSDVTLSFWCKSSVAQNFYARLQSYGGTQQSYVMETGSLTANTWTKITKTIQGGAAIAFDNNNNIGLLLEIVMFRGTNKTGTRALNIWEQYDTNIRVPDMTSTWYTTNDATFEVTGVQLEVGDTATDFEHRSYGEELSLCQRYYWKHGNATESKLYYSYTFGESITSTDAQVLQTFPVKMRAIPSLSTSGAIRWYSHNTGYPTSTSFLIDGNGGGTYQCAYVNVGFSGLTQGSSGRFMGWSNTDAYMEWDAEL